MKNGKCHQCGFEGWITNDDQQLCDDCFIIKYANITLDITRETRSEDTMKFIKAYRKFLEDYKKVA